MEIISWSEAKHLGLKTYYTGKPCKHGHVTERVTSSLTCAECNRIKAKQHTRDNPEKNKARCKAHYEKNKGTYITKVYERNGKVRQATIGRPEEIQNFYSETHDIGKVVDHILPLQGKEVCGLHCIANLQAMDAASNLAKSNKLDPELYPEQILLNTTLDIIPVKFRTLLKV